jgi:F-box and WD-40 domain protein CDC4
MSSNSIKQNNNGLTNSPKLEYTEIDITQNMNPSTSENSGDSPNSNNVLLKLSSKIRVEGVPLNHYHTLAIPTPRKLEKSGDYPLLNQALPQNLQNFTENINGQNLVLNRTHLADNFYSTENTKKRLASPTLSAHEDSDTLVVSNAKRRQSSKSINESVSASPTPSVNSPSHNYPDTVQQAFHTNPDDFILPSPSLSPSAVHQDIQRFVSPNPRPQNAELAQIPLGANPEDLPQSVLNIPNLISQFDSLPRGLRTYLLYLLLQRSERYILQFLASNMYPALRIDLLSTLPVEVSQKVLYYLDSVSLFQVGAVCKQWRHLSDSNDDLWNHCLTKDDLQPSKTPSYTQALMEKFYLTRPKLPEPEISAKEVYRRQAIMENNWWKGIAHQTSFLAHGRNVVTCLQFDDQRIVTGSDDMTMGVFDTNSGRLIHTLSGHEGGVWALQYVGSTLASGSTDRTLRIWDLDSGVCRHVFPGHTSTVRCLQILMPQPSTTQFNSDGTPKLEPPYPLVVTGSRDTHLRVWKLPSPSEDDPFIGNDGTHPSEPEHNPYHLASLRGHTQSVRAVAGHGNIVVSGSYDNDVRVWDLTDFSCKLNLEGHNQKVYCVALDTERNRCASGSLDATVRVWNMETGECIWTLEGKPIQSFFNYI